MKWGGILLVVYDSLTGQCERFAQKLEMECVNILDFEASEQSILLVTRSWDFGKITDETQEFLEDNKDKVVGVAVGGNRNWGSNFGAAGDKIQQQYGIPLILKFEGSGFRKDVEFLKQWIETYKEA